MRVFIGLVVLLLQVVATSSVLTTPPRDTAAKKDSTNVQLNCTSDKGADDIEWKVYVTWLLDPIQIFPSTNIKNFTSEQDGSSIYINSMSDDLAAVYSCQDDDDVKAANARVASIGYFQCPDVEEVSPGDAVASSCSVTYASNVKSPIRPLLLTIAMLDQQGNVLLKERATKPGVLSTTYNHTAQEDSNDSPFQCRIFFEGDNDEPAIDLNLPLYTETCEYYIKVPQPVTQVEFDESLKPGEENQFYVDDVINCTANGRPEPTINWLGWDGNVLSSDGSLLLTNEMIGSGWYTCKATNQIEDENHVVSANVSLIISSREAEIKDEGVAPWGIALAVLIPLLILIPLIAILVIYCLRRRGRSPKRTKTSKSKKAKPEKPAKAAYSSAPTNDVIYTPSRGTGAAYPNFQTAPVPGRPIYNNNNNRFANPSTDKYANQDEFTAPEPISVHSGHGALGMTGLSGSKQDLVGSKNSVGDFPQPPKKPHQMQSYNPISPNGRTPRPPLSGTESMSPSKRGAAKKKPVPLHRPPSINSNSTTRSLISSEVTSGGEGRSGSERKKKKKGGEYVVKNTSPASPPDQYKQKTARPSPRKNPANPPRGQDDSDGSEV